MKKFSIFALIIVAIILICAVQPARQEYIRIHIRANSNSSADQNVKYSVKNSIVSYLTPRLANCTSKTEAMSIVKSLECELSDIATATLKSAGYSYTATAKLKQEEFPTRTYDGTTLDAGVYDALIVSLGEAKGDNWWCVLFPPLCFVPATDSENSGEIVYKSKILETFGYYGR